MFNILWNVDWIEYKTVKNLRIFSIQSSQIIIFYTIACRYCSNTTHRRSWKQNLRIRIYNSASNLIFPSVKSYPISTEFSILIVTQA